MVLEACRFGNAKSMLTAAQATGSAHVEEVMVTHVFVHLLLGLNYLHANHIAHRDIKLENVLVDDALTFKLGDFGTARRIDDMLTTFAGTPVYMAPEVCPPTPYKPALSLIPTVTGNTVRSFSTHGHQSAAKGSSTIGSRSDIRLILTFLIRLCGLMSGGGA
jgi:serine/threonine protein kinase